MQGISFHTFPELNHMVEDEDVIHISELYFKVISGVKK